MHEEPEPELEPGDCAVEHHEKRIASGPDPRDQPLFPGDSGGEEPETITGKLEIVIDNDELAAAAQAAANLALAGGSDPSARAPRRMREPTKDDLREELRQYREVIAGQNRLVKDLDETLGRYRIRAYNAAANACIAFLIGTALGIVLVKISEFMAR